MPRLEQQDFQGGRGFGAERLPLTPAPSVLPAWFGGLVAVLVIVVAAFYGKANPDWDWVDIFGEGSVLAILLVVYARVARTALVSAVRMPLMTGLLLMIAAASADWADEFLLAMPFLNLLENFGFVIGGPCVLYALFAEEQIRGRESSRLQRQAQHFESMALRDALTGVGSRHAFEWQFASRAPQGGFALLLLDIDGFKRVNDENGHAVGDDILRLTGGLLRDSLREGDFAYRYGGEEFALVINTAEVQRAREIAERLRANFAALEHPALEFGRRAGTYGTLSVGVAMAAPGLDAPALFKAADQALYRAKAGGRNRVETA